jgi:hypothetical protein
MARSVVSPEVKAAALVDLVAGEQPAAVAQRYGLGRDLVNKWKQRAMSTPVSTDMSTPVSSRTSVVPVRYPAIEEHQRRIHDLMYRLLIAKLEASEHLANHTTTDWLNRQSAEGLAELGDYLDRTAIGILALLVRGGGASSNGDNSSGASQ